MGEFLHPEKVLVSPGNPYSADGKTLMRTLAVSRERERAACLNTKKTVCYMALVANTTSKSMARRGRSSTRREVETLKVVVCTAGRTWSAHRSLIADKAFALVSDYRSWNSRKSPGTDQVLVNCSFFADSSSPVRRASVRERQSLMPLCALGPRASSLAFFGSCVVQCDFVFFFSLRDLKFWSNLRWDSHWH
jgi:hypothetical protein